jgi:hypothetical protein
VIEWIDAQRGTRVQVCNEGISMSVQHHAVHCLSGDGGPQGHRRRSPGHLVLLAVAFTVLAACGDDAENGVEPTDVPGGSGVNAELEIHYEHAAAGVDQTYTVTCTDSSAELSGDAVEVDADAACAALNEPAVVERLTQGPPEDQVCTEIYGGDDTAEIEGTIGEQSVDTVADRTNGCAITTWDELLAPILPPAVGVVEPTTTTG